ATAKTTRLVSATPAPEEREVAVGRRRSEGRALSRPTVKWTTRRSSLHCELGISPCRRCTLKNLALDSLPLMKRCLFLLTLFCAGCGSHQPPAWDAVAVRPNHPWGYYSGQVEARWENDGRHMTLLSELRYIDPDGVVWIAPAGSVVDGASIPRVLWSFMGGPFDGKYRNASVLHDVAYDQKTRPWKEADRMFYNAMRCSGVSP